MKRVVILAMCLTACTVSRARAQTPPADKPTMEIYGFGMVDAIADFNQTDPNWCTTPSGRRSCRRRQPVRRRRPFLPERPSEPLRREAPTADVGRRGQRQFEFDMFGTGNDAGQTTIRPAARVGPVETDRRRTDQHASSWTRTSSRTRSNTGARTAWCSSEPAGSSRGADRNGGSNARIAVEAPGASGDARRLRRPYRAAESAGRFPLPDFTGHYRRRHVGLRPGRRHDALHQAATTRCQRSSSTSTASAWGWGLAVSSANSSSTPNDTLHVQLVDGQGVENYFNDAPIDIGLKSNAGNTGHAGRPGKALRRSSASSSFSITTGTERYTTTVGYSRVDITNSDGQAPTPTRTVSTSRQPALHAGQN